MKTTKDYSNRAAEAIPACDYNTPAGHTLDGQSINQPCIVLHITRTMVESIPLPRDPNGMGLSIGEQINNFMRVEAESGATVSDIHLEIPPDEWNAFRAAIVQRRT